MSERLVQLTINNPLKCISFNSEQGSLPVKFYLSFGSAIFKGKGGETLFTPLLTNKPFVSVSALVVIKNNNTPYISNAYFVANTPLIDSIIQRIIRLVQNKSNAVSIIYDFDLHRYSEKKIRFASCANLINEQIKEFVNVKYIAFPFACLISKKTILPYTAILYPSGEIKL